MGKDKHKGFKANTNVNPNNTQEEEVAMTTINPETNNTNIQEEVAMTENTTINTIDPEAINTNNNANLEDIGMEQNYDEKVMALADQLGMDPEQIINDMEIIDASNKRTGSRTGSGRWASTRDFVIRQLKIAAATGRKTFYFGDMVRACILPQTGIWAAWKYQGKLISAAEVRAQKIPVTQLKVVSDITDKQMRYRQCMNYIRNNFLSLSGDEGNKVGKAKGGLPTGWSIRYTEGGKGADALAFIYKAD